MFYVGLDIHSKHVSICVLNEDGKVFHRAQVRTIYETLGLAWSDVKRSTRRC